MPADPSSLLTVFIETNFTETVTITDDLAMPPTSIESVITDIPLPDGIIITKTTETITVSGKYSAGLFPGTTINYITRGFSDKLESPGAVSSFDDIPIGKQVFSYKPPVISEITITFMVNFVDSALLPGNTTFTQDVVFNYDKGALKLREFI